MSSPIDRLNAGLAGRYQVLDEAARGGMATVYRARDLRHDRTVAIKVLNPELSQLVQADRFIAEIRTTARLTHPHILPLHDSGSVDGLLFYATPFIEGETLRQRLEREPQLPVDEAVRIALEVAEALAYAHRQGVVHRDIKPSNILLHEGGVLVADFGVALLLGTDSEERITESGFSIGSPEYMSPEQAAGESDIDHRADIYALACVLHEMLAGEPLFTGSTTRAIAAKHIAVPPTPIRTLRSRVPVGLEGAVLRALEKSRVDRFQSVEAFAKAIRESVSDRRRAKTSADAPSPRAPSTGGDDESVTLDRGPRPTLRGMLGLAAVVVVVIAGIYAESAYLDLTSSPILPSSAVVIPFAEASSSEQERELAVGIADAVEQELRRWDPIRVPSGVDLAGPRAAMGLDEPTLERTEDGLELARQVGAEAMIALITRIRGDSVEVHASMVSARSGVSVEEEVTAPGPPEALRMESVVAPIVARVLGLDGELDPTRAIGAGTRSPEAAAEFLAGLQDLRASRLDEAESHFRSAVETDSTFASALSYLGQTLFWRAKESPGGLDRLGPEVTRWSTAAMSRLGGLSAGPASHVRGFFQFQRGDYEQAREIYASILEADSSDVSALLLQSQIELFDRWLVPSSDGAPVPRSDLARARSALGRAVAVDPNYELAYGQVFEIQSMIEASVTAGVCMAFDVPVEEVVPFWQTWTPSATTLAFCPVVLDSLQWLAREDFEAADRDRLRQGADVLFEQAVGELERWSSIAPNRPRPYEMLSEALLSERARLGVVAPARHQQIADDALGYLERAVELRGEDDPVDLVNLANLTMAAGAEDRAVELARRAVAAYEAQGRDSGSRPPMGIVNVLARAGQGAAALEIVSRYAGEQLVQDPETGRLLSLAGAEIVLNRIRLMAALGLEGETVRREIDLLRSSWAGAGYTSRQLDLLSSRVATRTATALSNDSSALAEWSEYVSSDDPVWRALVLSHGVLSAGVDDPAAEALELARSSIADADGGEAFVLGRVAARLGRPEEAVRYYSRLDSLPFRVNESFFDGGWGLQVVSFALRAEAYEELGDRNSAAEMVERYLRARTWPDSLAASGVERARELLASLSES